MRVHICFEAKIGSSIFFRKGIEIPALPPVGTLMFLNDQGGEDKGEFGCVKVEQILWREGCPEGYGPEGYVVMLEAIDLEEDSFSWLESLGWTILKPRPLKEQLAALQEEV